LALRTVPLAENHRRADFCCEREPGIESFFRQRAWRDVNKGVSRCRVLVDDDAPDVVLGFYTLSAAVIDPATIDVSGMKLPPYNPLPAFLLGKMGLDTRFQGHELGTTLLRDCYARVAEIAQHHLGGIGLLVDPKNPRLARWYIQRGFFGLAGTSRLFIPLQTIESILAGPDSPSEQPTPRHTPPAQEQEKRPQTSRTDRGRTVDL
jgi:hypothetical protein